MNRRRRWIAGMVGWVLLATGVGSAAESTYDLSGRVSPQLAVTTYPDNSIFRDVFGSSSLDSSLDLRVVLGLQRDRWSVDVDYQLVGLVANRLALTRELPEEPGLLLTHLPNDRTRLFDLTHVLTDSGRTAALQRLDRLAVGFTTDHLVMKFGRQAITWGNGLVFSVMDIFNPFDPAAIDKEYKTGDDMLYGQYLLPSGNDLQSVVVFRRSPLTGDVEADQGSLALKYHHMASASELDVLLAHHYGETLAAGGFNYSIGGAVWRGDLGVTFADDDTVVSLLTSLSQAWTWSGKNLSGVAEYFYNGFGRPDGCYSPPCLAQSPPLLERVGRGEIFNLGRHYVALSVLIEVNPLFQLTPNVFLNAGDPSALAQVVFQNDLRQDLLLWSALNLPLGADGTELGGGAANLPGRYLSAGPSATIQLAWYW